MRAIKEGDLVYIALPRLCCGYLPAKAPIIGYTFVVKFMDTRVVCCRHCGHKSMMTLAHFSRGCKNFYVNDKRLKLINPPSLPLKTVTKEKELA